ncbi:hypothetical protein [Microbacterium sp. Root553]|uniref:hypothetical protein n=1 Tax=Microbacterium sp. Root553 TaxID=1736556 RepID=UPI000A9F5BC6|nr:hypothetical protein [Microbacterium sp. Root553]
MAQSARSEAGDHDLEGWLNRSRPIGSGPGSRLLEGFSGSTPYEICERFAAGLIEESQVIDELVRYPYAPGGTTDGYDSLIVDPPGTWSEVSTAARHGLIGDNVYEAVFNRRHPSSDSENPSVGPEELNSAG